MSLVIIEDIIKNKVSDMTDSDAAKLCKIIGKSLRVENQMKITEFLKMKSASFD